MVAEAPANATLSPFQDLIQRYSRFQLLTAIEINDELCARAKRRGDWDEAKRLVTEIGDLWKEIHRRNRVRVEVEAQKAEQDRILEFHWYHDRMAG